MPRRNFKGMIDEKYNGGRLERYVFNIIPQRDRGNDITKGDNPNYLVLLKDSNSVVIEDKITNDKNYITFANYIFQHFASEHQNNFPLDDRTAVLSVVRMIDIENSTNVWRFNRDGLIAMVDYIVDNHDIFLANLLSDNDSTRCGVVETLINAVNPEGEDSDETEPRSLASKICKYLAQYITGGNDNLYFINDSFVRKTLPFYCAYYEVTIPYKYSEYADDYKKLFEILEALRLKAAKVEREEPLTRGHMDHIMWYCYKNSGNEGEFTRIEKPKVPTISALDKWFVAFINAYGIIDIETAFSMLQEKFEDYTFDLFNVDITKPLIATSRYYIIKDGKLSNKDLSDDAFNHLLSIHSRVSEYSKLDSNNKIGDYAYQTNKAQAIVGEIAKKTKRDDLKNDTLVEEVRKAIFETFVEALPEHIASLINDQTATNKIKRVLIDKKVKLPILKGDTIK